MLLYCSKTSKNEDLKQGMIEGEIGENGKETIRCLSFDIVFTYAIKAVQMLHQLVEQQQAQIDAHTQQIERLINVKLNA